MFIVDRLVDKIATSGADKQTTFNKSKLCKIIFTYHIQNSSNSILTQYL